MSKTAAMLAASLFLSSVHAGEAPPTTLIVFTAPEWCQPCRRLEATVLKSQEWADLKHAKKIVDIDDHKALAKKHKVKSVPCAVLLDAKGHEVARVTGYSGESPEKWLAPFK